MRTGLASLILLSILGGTFIPVVSAAAEAPCVDFEVIAARGSKAEPQGPVLESDYELDTYRGMGNEGNEFYKKLLDEFPDKTIARWGVRYPATGDTSEKWFAPINSVYSDSVQVGVSAVQSEIVRQHLACPDTRFVLFGYSQGVDVIAGGIATLTVAQKGLIIATVLFGDVQFNPADTKADRGKFDPEYFGMFGVRPKWDQLISSPVFSYCRNYDIACNSRHMVPGLLGPTIATDYQRIVGAADGTNVFAEHEKYVAAGTPAKAALAVAKSQNKPCPAPPNVRPVSLSGTSSAVVGQPAVFSAVDTAVNECDSVTYRWSVTPIATSTSSLDVSPLGTTTERSGYQHSTNVGVVPSTVEPFTDEGPYLSRTFDAPGTYLVEVVTPTADGDVSASIEVTVTEAPTEVPAPPLLTTTVVNGTTVLRWTAGDGTPAGFYSIVDAGGNAVENLNPAELLDAQGNPYFEYELPATSPAEGAPYSVQAVNAVGATAARLAVPAAEATYEHQIQSSPQIDGRRLTLSGPMTTDLDLIRDQFAQSDPATLTGPYTATFAAGSGETLAYDMTGADASVSLGPTQWQIVFNFGDDVDSNGTPVWELMRGGFATALLSSGTISAEIGGHQVTVRISDATVATEENKHTIARDVAVPAGVPVDEYGGWDNNLYQFLDLSHNGTYDPSLLPLSSEISDLGSFDWEAAQITDVHTYIGNDEIDNLGAIEVFTVQEAASVDDYSVRASFNGTVGDGTYLTMRSFITSGAVSFRVDGGAPNVLEMRATVEQAQDAFPAPTAPEFLETSSTLTKPQYRFTQWQPQVNWGMDGEGSVVITSQVPGLQFDGQELHGTPYVRGSYQITVDATNATGTTTRVYTIEVVEGYSDAKYYISGASSIQRQANGTFSIYLGRLDYLRLDNPNMTRWLPALGESGIADGELANDSTQFTAENFAMYKPDGTPIPVTGTFTVTMTYNSQGQSFTEIRSSNAVFGNNTAATVNALWSLSNRITFTRAGGALNEIWRGGYNPHVT